ncbi:pilus assembly protein CpaE [Rhodophyticola sp. CCM32]|uniref:AAA family ATPase n=1 Tax=Rhodophyticola sp. CCM32 TaxID=2916397 RepID=UPI00107F7F89|nr:AAA family ATPase [Rhodophyticola sp. CCM32]QBY01189.1 pilus assembly protein CpaE [Rhodophyticola sp. CCM32]
MGGGLALKSDPAPIVASTISRDVQKFGLLIDDMEAELGESWGDLQLEEARSFLDQTEANELEFVAIAVDQSDEDDIGLIGEIIRAAKAKSIRVILITDGLSTQGLHQLLKLGADDFVPYPLPDRALHDAIKRIREPHSVALTGTGADGRAFDPAPRMDGRSAIFAVQGLAGGTGATTLAINLAWEMANIDKKKPPSVCLIDFDLQFGSTSTFLDLPRREVIVEVLSDAQGMDVDSFKQALVEYNDKLSVFTAPSEIIPLDMISPEDVEAVLNLATECFDIVVIDMPASVVQWSETILQRADVFFAMLELDMRSAQNAMRFIKALQAEELPLEKVNFILNRAPKGLDLNGKSRVKRLADSLGVKITTQLTDGARQVTQSADHGIPLAELAKKNPLRKDIVKLASGLYQAMLSDVATG